MLLAQMDLLCLPWLDMRAGVLAAPGDSGEVCEGARNAGGVGTGGWRADSAAASLYELFVWQMTRRLVRAKAPRSYAWAFGAGFTMLTPRTLIGHNLICLLARLMEECPRDWFGRPWLTEVDAALAAAYAELRGRFGPDERRWAWGPRPACHAAPSGVGSRAAGPAAESRPVCLGWRLRHRQPGREHDGGSLWRG